MPLPDIGGWRVGSIKLGGLYLPPRAVPYKSSSNGVYFRFNASSAVVGALGGSFDWRFEYSHVSVSGGGMDTETLWAWGSQGDDGIMFRNGNNNNGTGIPGITVVLYGATIISFDVTLSENVFDYAVHRTLRVTRDVAGETWTVYTGPSIDGPWTQIGQRTITPFAVGSELSSAYFLSWGIPAGLGIQDASSGRLYKMRLHGDPSGSTPAVINADFTQVFDSPSGGAVSGSFTDYTGILWEYAGVEWLDPTTP